MTRLVLHHVPGLDSVRPASRRARACTANAEEVLQRSSERDSGDPISILPPDASTGPDASTLPDTTTKPRRSRSERRPGDARAEAARGAARGLGVPAAEPLDGIE